MTDDAPAEMTATDAWKQIQTCIIGNDIEGAVHFFRAAINAAEQRGFEACRGMAVTAAREVRAGECPFGLGKEPDIQPEDPCPRCGQNGVDDDGSLCVGTRLGATIEAIRSLTPEDGGG